MEAIQKHYLKAAISNILYSKNKKGGKRWTLFSEEVSFRRNLILREEKYLYFWKSENISEYLCHQSKPFCRF